MSRRRRQSPAPRGRLRPTFARSAARAAGRRSDRRRRSSRRPGARNRPLGSADRCCRRPPARSGPACTSANIARATSESRRAASRSTRDLVGVLHNPGSPRRCLRWQPTRIRAPRLVSVDTSHWCRLTVRCAASKPIRFTCRRARRSASLGSSRAVDHHQLEVRAGAGARLTLADGRLVTEIGEEQRCDLPSARPTAELPEKFVR